MCIDRPAAAAHADPPFPPGELPRAHPALCCGGCRVGGSVRVERSSKLEQEGPSGVRISLWHTLVCPGVLFASVVSPVPGSGTVAVTLPSRYLVSPPAKAALIYFQATQKGCFGVGSAGKTRLNRRCRDVFPHGEWWGGAEQGLGQREAIMRLIFLCDLIKM